MERAHDSVRSIRQQRHSVRIPPLFLRIWEDKISLKIPPENKILILKFRSKKTQEQEANWQPSVEAKVLRSRSRALRSNERDAPAPKIQNFSFLNEIGRPGGVQKTKSAVESAARCTSDVAP